MTSETATNGRTRDAAPAGRKKLPTRLSSLFPKVTGTIKRLRKYYEETDVDRFFEAFMYYLKFPISGYVER